MSPLSLNTGSTTLNSFDLALFTVDESIMARCVQLAERARGFTSPNPLVGCVVLDAKGTVVGEGWHQRAGEGHAEVNALAKAGKKAQGGTLYVNLEPCHHSGKTPPCTQAIMDAGIATVVFGTLDPNPLVQGRGRDALKQHRVNVRYGVLDAVCQQLNRVFFHAVQYQHPFVTAKLALTMDGHLNTRQSSGAWLTSPLSKQWAHQLRAQHDVILTTAQSILADDSQLTVREGLVQSRQPMRVVLDRQGRLRERTAALFQTTQASPVIHVVSSSLQTAWPHIDTDEVSTWFVPETGVGLCVQTVLKRLYTEKEVLSVMVEAGGTLVSHLLNQQLVQEMKLFYVPVWLMDSGATRASGGQVALHLSDAPRLEVVGREPIENDLLVTAIPRYT